MEPILLIVAAVVVVLAIVAVRALSKNKNTLTSGTEAKPAPSERKALSEPEAEAPSAKAPAAEPKPSVEAPEAKAEPAAEPAPSPAEKIEPAAAPETAPAPSGPTAEDAEAIKSSLKNTRGGFIARLASLFGGGRREIDPALLEEIEEILITADIGVRTTEKILTNLRERLERDELGDEARIWAALREEAGKILTPSAGGLKLSKKPTVILVAGVNGVGKTTTIGKLASRLTQEGKTCLLVAGDTFRAAAVLQLEVWGRRVGCEVVKGKDRADPSAVVFDAVEKGIAAGVDVIIADTAGRLHTKSNLMDELSKVGRSIEKALGRPADEILLVLDSTTGQNAIQQAQLFREAIPVSGIVLTKLDGTAKGGVVLGIVDEHRIPVRFVGVGERVEDLRAFDASTFVDALFERPAASSSASAE